MLRGHKFVTLIISLLGAVVLWLYVVTSIKPQVDFPVSSIPISIIDRTLEERGLVITSQTPQNMTLDLRTSRANVSKLNAETINVYADASNVREPGQASLQCVVTFPDTVRSSDVDILRKSVDNITITVDRLQRTAFPIQFKGSGKVKSGFSFENPSVVIDPTEVVVTGPEHEVEKIKSVVVEYDISDLEETVVVTEPIHFLDENGAEIEFSDLVSFNLTETSVTLPVLRTKELKLKVEFIEGGGVTVDNVRVELNPPTIQVKGEANVIDSLDDELVIGTIDLSVIPFFHDDEFPISPKLRAGVRNVNGEESVKVVIRLTGVSEDTINISDIRVINPPDPKEYNTRVTTSTVKVNLRGSTEEIAKIKANNGSGIYVEVDLASYSDQTGAFSVQGRVVNETYPSVSVSGTAEIGVSVSQRVESDEE